jgi:hypothetical protein
MHQKCASAYSQESRLLAIVAAVGVCLFVRIYQQHLLLGLMGEHQQYNGTLVQAQGLCSRVQGMSL